jgi:hypothetical protein
MTDRIGSYQLTSLEQFEKNAREIADENLAVLRQKHQDYGPKNISGAPRGPMNGLLVRLYDKLSRMEHLLETGADAQNESLRDTMLDIANYGLIGQMAERLSASRLTRIRIMLYLSYANVHV